MKVSISAISSPFLTSITFVDRNDRIDNFDRVDQYNPGDQ
jgi:hypothetical protein